MQGGPSFEIQKIVTDSYYSGFHYSPLWEATFNRNWHNRSDRLSVAFPLCANPPKKRTVQVEA